MKFLARDGRLRLRTILLIAHFVIFSVMLIGLVFLRLMDGMLIRKTENSLLAQGGIITTVYALQYADKYPDTATWDDHSVLASAERQAKLRVEDQSILHLFLISIQQNLHFQIRIHSPGVMHQPQFFS